MARITREEMTTARSLAKILNVEPTPDPRSARPYTPKSKGKRTGMGVCKFWALLFVMNEKLPLHEKMSDNEIKRQVLVEFPNQKSTKRLKEGKQTVNYHRTLYNTGRYTPQETEAYGKPAENNAELPRSYRYNSIGQRVAGHNPKRVLPPDQQPRPHKKAKASGFLKESRIEEILETASA